MMSASAYGSSTKTRDSGPADLFKNGSGSSNFGFRISMLLLIQPRLVKVEMTRSVLSKKINASHKRHSTGHGADMRTWRKKAAMDAVGIEATEYKDPDEDVEIQETTGSILIGI